MTDPAAVSLDLLQRRVDELIAENDTLRGKGGSNGTPPGGNELEKRVQDLEKAIPDIREKLVRVESRLESVDKHGATKADLATMEGTLIKWFVGTAFAMVGLATAIGFGLARILA